MEEDETTLGFADNIGPVQRRIVPEKQPFDARGAKQQSQPQNQSQLRDHDETMVVRGMHLGAHGGGLDDDLEDDEEKLLADINNL